MASDPRDTAFRLLQSGQKTQATLDRAIEDAAREIDALTPKDRALCNAIVFGVLRHRGHIDHIIRSCARRPFAELDPKVLTLLRIGVFQLVYLDRIPDFAAIHSSIDLAKVRTGKNAAGFINAVLRKAADTWRTLDLPDRKRHFPAYLAAGFSIPQWLGKRWTTRYGKTQTEELGRALLDIPAVTLRVNPMKTSRDKVLNDLCGRGFQAVKTPRSRLGIKLTSPGGPVTDLPGFDAGMFQIQDEAAQLVVELLAPKPGERILDACAGLGTKTCHIGQLMDNRGEIVANDPGAGKHEGLQIEASRLGLTQISTTALDIRKTGMKDFGGYFDRVLVDAPCTGLGVLRRNPDTRWKRTAKDITRMAAIQKKILKASASLVAPGGVLVYAVCSCEPEENEEVIRHFLEKRKDFIPDPGGFSAHLPGFSNPDRPGFQFGTFPVYKDMDGFFTARMKRKQTP